MPGSRHYPDSPWPNFAYQGSSWTFDAASVGVDEGVFHGNDFLGFAYERPDLETEAMIQWPVQYPGRGSQRTPKDNDDAEKWESPGAMPPPDSSSPLGLMADASPYASSTRSGLPMSRCADVTTGQLLSCRLRDGGEQSGVQAQLFDGQAEPNAFIFPTTTSFERSLSLSPAPKHQTRQVPPTRINMAIDAHDRGHTSKGSPSKAACSAARGPLDEHPRATSGQHVVASVPVHSICASTTRISSGQTRHPDEIKRVFTRMGPVPLSRKRALLPGPTVLDLAISNESEPSSSRGTEGDGPRDASSEINGKDGVPSKMPSRHVSIVSPAQAPPDGCLKRRRSLADCPPESKKLKLDRTVSHVSCASNTSVEPEYQATELASIRRARSLRSEASACSNEQAVRS